MEFKGVNYQQKREAILFMLNYYSRDLTEDPRCNIIGIEDLDYLYQLDQNMVMAYQQELLLLEGKKLLGLIK